MVASVSRGTPYQLLTSAQGVRRWPFVAVLLSVFFLGSAPWLYSRIVPEVYDDQDLSTLPDVATPYDMMYNPVGQNHTFERAQEILNCTKQRWKRLSSQPSTAIHGTLAAKECPSYFHLIQKDLAPWKEKGITRASIEMARRHAAFRVVIWDGSLYVERFKVCYGNRALFSLWGMLLFLEKYRGKVPDVEFMFNCEDRPDILKAGTNRKGAALLFSYSSSNDHFDIPFPDWTFWGWSELFIGSWDEERSKIVKGSQKTDWKLKGPDAYWSGNPHVGNSHRPDLLKCNKPGTAYIHAQNWKKELPNGKQNSKLEDQCTHRYMIYVEGVGWSVSLKYILACGSPTLVISPDHYDFFSRGLQEWVDYIPIRPSDFGDELCEDIKKAVQFGDANKTEAIRIGKAGQDFMQKAVSMNDVYDYMFHLLREYSTLQKFQPSVGEQHHLVTLDQFRCSPPQAERVAMDQAMKVMPASTSPCQMSELPAGFKGFEWQFQGQ